MNREIICPEILDMSSEEDIIKLNKIYKNTQVIDRYKQMLQEYLITENPELSHDIKGREEAFNNIVNVEDLGESNLLHKGIWVYYPWSNKLIHCLDKNQFYKLRTSRNHDLVTSEEQIKLRDFNVGIIGLSVGQASALTLSISGMCEKMKLADPDIIQASNMNRMHATIEAICQKKTDYLAKKIYELNPFATLKLHPYLITENNIKSFIFDDFKLDLIIDAFDDIKMKIKLRIIAKKHKIPILMATDLGDGAIIDIERYDQNDNLPIFHGMIEENEMDGTSSKNIDYQELARIALKMIGPENIPKRMSDSIKLVGKKLAGHPQLALASFLGGSLIAYVVKKIALGRDIKTNRLYIAFDKLL